MIVKKIEIHENDIILGRGGSHHKYAGNQFLRDLAASLAPTYIRSSKREKSRFSRLMVDIVTQKEPPGRFLKHVVGKNDVFEEVHHSCAREKTSQCLRDAARSFKQLPNNGMINSEQKSSDSQLKVFDDAMSSHHTFHHTATNLKSWQQQIVHDTKRSVEQRSSEPISSRKEQDSNKKSYSYPKQEQYRITHLLPPGPPAVEASFGNFNYHEPHHLSGASNKTYDQSFQSQYHYHYQQHWKTHYSQIPPPPSHMMEKDVMRAQTTMSPQSIPYGVSNDHIYDHEGRVDKSVSKMVSPSPTRPCSSNDRFSQNNSNEEGIPDLFYLTKSTSRSFDSYSTYE